MPLVDLRCPSHGVQEVFEKHLQDTQLECPECGEKAERVYSIGSMGQITEFTAGYDRMLQKDFPPKRDRDDYLRKENLTKVG